MNATWWFGYQRFATLRFNGHPPLGVNATFVFSTPLAGMFTQFQRAPTLGGECYPFQLRASRCTRNSFNGHPPLGVNATGILQEMEVDMTHCFNGHPPLGVNATVGGTEDPCMHYESVSMGTHPWG